MTTVQNEFGFDEFVHWENHVSGTDPFSIPETEARATWYGVSGIPHVRIDGSRSVIGAGSCASAATNYRNNINARLAEVGNASPVQITGGYLPSASNVSVQATFRLVDPAALVSLRASLLVYENDIFWCCGYGGETMWDVVTRGIYDQNVVLTNVGDQVTLSMSFVHNGSWNPANTFATAYLQQTSGNKQIIQGVMLPLAPFTFTLDYNLRSVPDGNGAAIFNATLKNVGNVTDTFTLEPGAPLGNWTTDFLVCGDNTPHTEPVDVVLDPNEECLVKIRVHTDGTVEERTGGFKATSAATAMTNEQPMRVFNGSWSVLLVDDDDQNTDEAKFVSALNSMGYLFENWSVYGHGGQTPSFGNMLGFDYLIWQTGLRFSNLLSAADLANLMQYMDAGGSLFLASQGFLDTQTNPNTFVNTYLGVSSWVLDRRYVLMNGVAGDPIGNGLSLPLTYNIPSMNDGDHLVAGPTATGCFVAPDGSISTVRNTMPLRADAKAVFMATAFNTISDTNPDPNNTRVVLQRILNWLQPEAPASADDLGSGLSASRIDGARPNPFNPRTDVVFTLSGSDAEHDVRLEVFDIGGRKVAGLFDGQLSAGTHHQAWDGLADNGAAVRSGMYFARLTTQGGVKSEKLMLLK